MGHRRRAKLLNASYGLLGSCVIFVAALDLFKSGSSLAAVSECGTGSSVGGVAILLSLPVFGLVLGWAAVSLAAVCRVVTASAVTASVGLSIWNLVLATLLCGIALVIGHWLAAILAIELVCASLVLYTLGAREQRSPVAATDAF
jgi:hypothetical protein